LHKASLRQQLLQKRLTLPESEWREKSDRLVEQILAWTKGQSFEHYILYRSFRREPSLDKLASILPSACCYYPRIHGKALKFYPGDGDFEVNRFGLEEPMPHAARELKDFSPHTLLIIPAVAYDHQCFRLGYGGGFFDRFLSDSSLTTVGVCFEAFLLESLPHEQHDQPVQTVITEKRALTRAP
jgi:5-formyltetrahydrofolate cyclo-ligase